MMEREPERRHFALRDGSCQVAANWLRHFEREKVAVAIEVALSQVPDHFPTDPAKLDDYDESMRKVAKRLKKILTACLTEFEGSPNPKPDGKRKAQSEAARG